MTTAERGVIYISWGEAAAYGVEMSVKSLWALDPSLPVLVVGDDIAAQRFADRPGFTVYRDEVDPFESNWLYGFLAGRVKPRLAALSPFAQTLYVDADTVFKISPAFGFDLLDRWDMIVVEADERSLLTVLPENRPEVSQTIAEIGTAQILYHNSGVFFWRRNAVTARLFELWSEEWLRFQMWDEQVALLRALMRSEALFLNVPYTWNCRDMKKTFMVFHRFGSMAVRQFRGSKGAVARGLPMGRPLVEVELAPGRFVKVHVGDEEKAVENFRQATGSRRAM